LLTGAESPARVFSEIVGAKIVPAANTRDARSRIPLAPAYQHVMFVTAGSAEVEGTALGRGSLLYLSAGREQIPVAAAAGTRLLLLGGVPLGEPLLMWWNFVARTPEEIAAAVADWREGRFGSVGGYRGDPLQAPALDTARLRAARAKTGH